MTLEFIPENDFERVLLRVTDDQKRATVTLQTEDRGSYAPKVYELHAERLTVWDDGAPISALDRDRILEVAKRARPDFDFEVFD